jgi:hypothetical protein
MASTSQTKKLVVTITKDHAKTAREMTSRGRTILASQEGEFRQHNYPSGNFFERTYLDVI